MGNVAKSGSSGAIRNKPVDTKPISKDDLVAAYLERHRDSDYGFQVCFHEFFWQIGLFSQENLRLLDNTSGENKNSSNGDNKQFLIIISKDDLVVAYLERLWLSGMYSVFWREKLQA